MDSDQDLGDAGTPPQTQAVLEQPPSGGPSQPGSPSRVPGQKPEISLLKKHASQQQPTGSAGLSMLNSATHEREQKLLVARQARMERENEKQHRQHRSVKPKLRSAATETGLSIK